MDKSTKGNTTEVWIGDVSCPHNGNSKIPFMIMTSRHIHFGTVELIHNKAKGTFMTSIHQVVRAYHAGGFRICNILADGGFKRIRNNLADMGISLDIASRN